MGSWDMRCSLTGIPISEYQQFYLIPVVPDGSNNGDFPCTHYVCGGYKPILPPFKAEYCDYGGFKALISPEERRVYTKTLRSLCKNDLAELEDIGDLNRENPLTVEMTGYANKKVLQSNRPISIYAINIDIYEKITNTYNPVKYDGSNYLEDIETSLDNFLAFKDQYLQDPSRSYDAKIFGEHTESLNVHHALKFYDFYGPKRDSSLPDDKYITMILTESSYHTISGWFGILSLNLADEVYRKNIDLFKKIMRDLALWYKFCLFLQACNKFIIPYGNYGGQEDSVNEIKMLANFTSEICDKIITKQKEEAEE